MDSSVRNKEKMLRINYKLVIVRYNIFNDRIAKVAARGCGSVSMYKHTDMDTQEKTLNAIWFAI